MIDFSTTPFTFLSDACGPLIYVVKKITHWNTLRATSALFHILTILNHPVIIHGRCTPTELDTESLNKQTPKVLQQVTYVASSLHQCTSRDLLLWRAQISVSSSGSRPVGPATNPVGTVQGGSRGSSGSTVSDYGLDDRGSIPNRGRGIFF
jgi:hypothetical protein